MIHLQIHEMRDRDLIVDRWIKRTRGERSEHHKAPSRSFAYRNLELRAPPSKDQRDARSRKDPDRQYTKRTWIVDLSSISELRLSRLGVTRISIEGTARCEITMRSGPLIHQDHEPSIRVDEDSTVTEKTKSLNCQRG
jgi:hypothetical protein